MSTAYSEFVTFAKHASFAQPPFCVKLYNQFYFDMHTSKVVLRCTLLCLFISDHIVDHISPSLCFIILLHSLGHRGSSLSLVLSYVFTPVILVAYIWGRGLHKQTWKGWSWESLTEWGLFFKLGVPGMFMLCFEWWTFEISTVVAGAIDELQLAVNTVLMQFGMIIYAVRIDVCMQVFVNCCKLTPFLHVTDMRLIEVV